MKKIILILIGIIVATLIFLFIFDTNVKKQESVVINQKQDNKKTFQINICGRNYMAGPMYVEGVDVTRRISELVEKEYQTVQNKELTTCGILLASYPEGRTLETSLNKINSSQYHIVLEYEFLVDTNTNLIYNVNAIDGSTGSVLGTFR